MVWNAIVNMRIKYLTNGNVLIGYIGSHLTLKKIVR